MLMQLWCIKNSNSKQEHTFDLIHCYNHLDQFQLQFCNFYVFFIFNFFHFGFVLDAKSIDCEDNSDEEPVKCIEILKRCRKGEFKCSNGDCIPKSKFCDTVHDCNDNSDEPMNCTCLNYLK